MPEGPSPTTLELVEQARVEVERLVQGATGARRTRLIEIAEHMQSAVIRLEAEEARQ